MALYKSNCALDSTSKFFNEDAKAEERQRGPVLSSPPPQKHELSCPPAVISTIQADRNVITS